MDDVEILILCGGLGTRLSSVSNGTPKGLMKGPSGSPFIKELIDELAQFGFKRIILGLGYGADQYRNFFKTQARNDIKIRFSVESTPLGTGGSIINALKLIEDKTFFVINGDTKTNINYRDMLNFHKKKCAQITVSGLELMEFRGDVGCIKYDQNSDMLLELNEKSNDSKCVNAGIYVFEREVFYLKKYKTEKQSLEKTIIPDLISDKKMIYLYKFSGEMYDIGTPERYNNYIQKK